jgi:hypothetical protein
MEGSAVIAIFASRQVHPLRHWWAGVVAGLANPSHWLVCFQLPFVEPRGSAVDNDADKYFGRFFTYRTGVSPRLSFWL